MACNQMAAEGDFTTGTGVLMAFSRVMNSRSIYVASHCFSDHVVLDWFGRTIVGKTQVLNFIFDEANVSNHDIIEVKSHPNLPFTHSIERAMRRFRPSSFSDKNEDFDNMDDDSGFNSGIYEVSSDSSLSSSGSLTPCSKMMSGMSRLRVSKHKVAGHVPMPLSPMLRTPDNTSVPTIRNPQLKRQSALLRSLKLVDTPKNLQFINAAGIISFQSGDDSYDPGQSWSRPCHVQIGYQHQQSMEDVLFSFLLYNDDMPCRRNLSQVFDQCE